MTLEKHPDGRVEAALHMAELIVQARSINGHATIEGGIIRSLSSRIMQDAEKIQTLEKSLEVAVVALKNAVEQIYEGDDEEGWD